MIKKLQKLKAKKGFTLVELIVVIAIIGVLAAILIPTMLGFVTSSRVTSANSTAASIKKQIDNFLTDADTAGYGMKQSSAAKANITFKINADGEWEASVVTGTYTGGAAGGAYAQTLSRQAVLFNGVHQLLTSQRIHRRVLQGMQLHF